MPSVTVYIALPNSQRPGVDLSPMGHLWLGLTQDGGQTAYYGYYPKEDGTGTELYHSVPGAVHTNDNETFNYADSVTFKLNQDQYRAINEYVQQTKNNPPPYHALGNSCVSFVYNALSQAGIAPAHSLDGGSYSAIPANNALILHEMADRWNNGKGGPTPLASLKLEYEIVMETEKAHGKDAPETVAARNNYNKNLADQFPELSPSQRQQKVDDFIEQCARTVKIMDSKDSLTVGNRKDALAEYQSEAKAIMGNRGMWPGAECDQKIAVNMLANGYNKEEITNAMKIASLEIVGDKDANKYCDQVMNSASNKNTLAESQTLNQQDLAKNINVKYEKSVELIKEAGQAVSNLPRNPHSKDLFNAYAKEALDKNGQVWTADMNKTIAENMLKDGVRPPRIEEALKHSPESVGNAYYFIKDIRNSPEMQQIQQSKGVGINR